MAFLLAIEGADGAGKATVAAATAAALTARGLRATVVSFPRYTVTAGGHAIGAMLAGRLLAAPEPAAAAVLYALDRFESKKFMAEVAAENDVIVFDRYIASNIVYQAAKVTEEAAPALIQWIAELELRTFALPPPDLSIYLDTPQDLSRQLIAHKHQRSYTAETFDANEADSGLQRRVRERYAALAGGQVLGRWARVETVEHGALRPPADLAQEVLTAFDAARFG